ncbi:MAG TPA: hypothetical protein PKD90_11480 [Phnomibacter sp.]|nr:hypothetical protein [Phnomibacter sp.]
MPTTLPKAPVDAWVVPRTAEPVLLLASTATPLPACVAKIVGLVLAP